MTTPLYVALGNSQPQAMAPVVGQKVDLRTKQGRLHKQRLLAEAVELRKIGLTYKDIAFALRVSPEWAASNVWFKDPDVASADYRVLADRRHAIATGKDPDEVTAKRRERQWKRWRAKEWERVLRMPHMETFYLDSPLYMHPLRRGVERYVKDIVGVAPQETSDPQYELERAELYELLGDISVADVERMDPYTLERYQEKLREAGYAGWGRSVRLEERERLRDPAPMEQGSGRPDRLYIPAEDDEADLWLRGTGSRKDRKALAQSRKARQDQDRARLHRNRGKDRERWRGYENRRGRERPTGMSDDFKSGVR